MIVTLDAKRRLTVPAALAPAAPGDYFDARFDADEDAIVLRRLAGKEDWLAVLKNCPVVMDDVPPRRRERPRRHRRPLATREAPRRSAGHRLAGAATPRPERKDQAATPVS